jgi:transposase
MSKRYTAEFKRDAVALASSSEKTVTEVARDLGVSPEGLRGWVKQAKIDRGVGPAGAPGTTAAIVSKRWGPPHCRTAIAPSSRGLLQPRSGGRRSGTRPFSFHGRHGAQTLRRSGPSATTLECRPSLDYWNSTSALLGVGSTACVRRPAVFRLSDEEGGTGPYASSAYGPRGSHFRTAQCGGTSGLSRGVRQ